MGAILTGARWRFIEVPDWVLSRSFKAQQHWVAWKCRDHFRSCKGKLFMFGEIVGYRWCLNRATELLFDTNGSCIRAAAPQSGAQGYVKFREHVISTLAAPLFR
jgi:hypothetical protein